MLERSPRLRDIRDTLIDPRIAANGGRSVNVAGDEMVVEFGSADASLRCAVDIQRRMAERNRLLTGAERIEFRVGINLGDIIVDGTDIAGDGVNVAARLEALAEPGGICVSSAVRDQVHGSLDVAFCRYRREAGEEYRAGNSRLRGSPGRHRLRVCRRRPGMPTPVCDVRMQRDRWRLPYPSA